jgi:hypothetical protein
VSTRTWKIVTTLLAVAAAVRGGEALAEETPSPGDDFWSRVKHVRLGSMTLDFGGQLRSRFEYDDGFSLKGYTPGSRDRLLLERVRLDLAAAAGNGTRFFLQLQDAHAFLTRFGEEDFPASSPIEDTLDIRQLYVEHSRVGGAPFGFRIGRQQISYGDQRVFGPGNWGNTGRYAWDAAMVTIGTDRLNMDLWVGKYLQYKSEVWPNRPVPHFLTFVNYTQIRKLPLRLDLFYVLKRDGREKAGADSGSGTLLRHTIGAQAEGTAFKVFDASGTFARQFGRHGRDRITAFGASGKFGVTAPVAWQPRLGIQYTWGSGDRDPSDGVHGTFDGVYGGRDISFYGYLNLFFWANLRDAELDLSVKPWRPLTVHVEYHWFRLDKPRDAWYTTGLQPFRRDPLGRSGVNLGVELDARLTWAVEKHLELMCGYGRFWPDTFVRKTGPALPANWYFAQLLYNW